MKIQGSRMAMRDVNKYFGEAHVLRGVNLSINPGELVCFLGPSGCGKTTLLRIIAGLEKQNSGTLIQGEKDISHLPVKERDFGIVFQSYALFPNMTLFENIAFGLRCQRVSRDQINQRVNALLALVELSEHTHKYPAQISGGQQQRVALARALAPQPGLLLLDEPLSALDAKVRVHLRNEIRSLQKKLGVTTILVTHDQDEALAMADRIVVMNHGVIEQVGSPEEVYNQPATAFVANFIGSMNFLPAQTDESRQSINVEHSSLSFSHLQIPGSDGVQLAIRPEHVKVVPEIESEECAEVYAIEFMGAFMRCSLCLPLSKQILVADVTLNEFNSLSLSVGQRIGVRFEPNQVHCFAA